MKQRTITALIMAALFLPILIFGHHYHIFAIFCGLLAMFGTYEIMIATSRSRLVPMPFVYLTVLLTGGLYLNAYLAFTRVIPGLYVGFYLASVTFLLMLINVFFKSIHTHHLGEALLAMLYTGFGFLALALVRNSGLMLIIYVLATAMLTDTFAYFIGIKYGRHKLCPEISPKKSVEGAVSGLVIGGTLASLLAIWQGLFAMHWTLTVLLSFALSIIAQIGDLVASKIKRDHNIKDFSNLFPGHGGIMDRFDSWTFTALGLLIITETFDIVFLALVL